jgi:hypothetical protein
MPPEFTIALTSQTETCHQVDPTKFLANWASSPLCYSHGCYSLLALACSTSPSDAEESSVPDQLHLLHELPPAQAGSAEVVVLAERWWPLSTVAGCWNHCAHVSSDAAGSVAVRLHACATYDCRDSACAALNEGFSVLLALY